VDRAQAARQITESVAQLFFSAENQARFHGASEDLGVSPPMLKGLLELVPGEGVPMRDLAERWGCDASFVTVMCDGLEARGLVERRVADHDRRIKMVELTPAGAEARTRASDEVYGPRAGFDALTADEQVTLATLLRKLSEAQAVHDGALLESPGIRSMARRMSAQRTREYRGHQGGRGAAPWKAQFEAHRQELHSLKEELARVRDEIKAQARRPVDDAKAAKADMKARARRPVDQGKAAKAEIKEEIKSARDEVVNHLRGGRRRR
jgi:DNA-binding MarR family transcriptional regulator